MDGEIQVKEKGKENERENKTETMTRRAGLKDAARQRDNDLSTLRKLVETSSRHIFPE